MAQIFLAKGSTGFVIIGDSQGHTVIPQATPLRRLNYFDGKFLRAPDLKLEQQGQRDLVHLSNRASGQGVVYGYGCTLEAGDRLGIGAGLAIDPQGRVIYMPESLSVGIAELIEKSRLTPSGRGLASTAGGAAALKAGFEECEIRAGGELPGQLLGDEDLYLIVVSHAEAYCGEEDVYGKLCEEACIGSTERPYILSGVAVRAVPLNLTTPLRLSGALAISGVHLRSRVASAYFEDERLGTADLIGADGLGSNLWCMGAAAETGDGVAIGVLGRSGATTRFLDAWIARREAMETPPRRYWAFRMAMRPWNVFLAQVLQFQCQLKDLFKGLRDGGTLFDPCADEREIAGRASKAMAELLHDYEAIAGKLVGLPVVDGAVKPPTAVQGLAQIKLLQQDLAAVARLRLIDRALIDGGIIETPAAGYLPVSVDIPITVNQQVRRLMGEGVDLRFCVVRPDCIPHALEEAQHMERISLLQGLENPSDKPRVDVLVPSGRIEHYEATPAGAAYEMEVGAGSLKLLFGVPMRESIHDPADSSELTGIKRSLAVNTDLGSRVARTEISARLEGAARREDLSTGGYAFYFAGQSAADRIGSQILQQAGTSILAVANEVPSTILTLLGGEGAGAPVEERFTDRQVAGATAAGNPRDAVEMTGLKAGLTINPSATGAGGVAAWVSLRLDDDPFSLGPGGHTSLSAKLMVLSASLREVVATRVRELSIHGRLEVMGGGQSGTALRCRLSGDAVVYGIGADIPGGRETAFSVRLNDVVFIEPAAQGGGVEIRIDNPTLWAGAGSVRLRVLAKSGSGRIRVAATLERTAVQFYQGAEEMEKAGPDARKDETGFERPITLFQARLSENAEVLKSQHRLHGASLEALRRISAAIGDGAFYDGATRDLFPPARAVPEELRVYATRDWVFFHRRRDIECGAGKLPVAVAATRRYRLYQVTLGDLAARDTLRRALELNQGAQLAAFNPITGSIVEFEPLIPRLRTSHEAVQRDWETRVPGAGDIAYGAIASQGAAFDEGETLAGTRLERLTNVLSAVAEMRADATLQTLGRLPDLFHEGEVDGVIVIATLGVAVVCHEVWRLVMPAEEFDEKVVPELGGDNVLSILKEVGARRVKGDARFRRDTDQLFGDNAAAVFATAWQDGGDGAASRAVLVSRVDADGQSMNGSNQDKQSLRLAAITGGGDLSGALTSLQTSGAIARKCHSLTVLVTKPTVMPVHNGVYVFAQPLRGGPDAAEKLEEWLSANGFLALFEASTVAGGGGAEAARLAAGISSRLSYVDEVVFDKTSNNVLEGEQSELVSAWQTLLAGAAIPAGTFLRTLSITRPSASAAQVNAARLQAEAVTAALALTGETRSVTDGGPGPLPGNAESVSLIYIAVPSSGGSNLVMVTASLDSGAPPDAAIANLPENLSFDPAGNLVRNAAFDAAVARLKKARNKLNAVELVSVDKPGPEMERRADSLLEALREAGVARLDASATTREVNEKEREAIERTGLEATGAIVFRK